MALILTDDKRRLLFTAGHILVRGGAGSGKTTIALAKACVDLQAGRLGASGKALFLSFARATVARVAEQATEMIAANELLRIEINTYHGFAWSILKSHGYLLCAKPGVRLLLPTKSEIASRAWKATPEPPVNASYLTKKDWLPLISFRP